MFSFEDADDYISAAQWLKEREREREGGFDREKFILFKGRLSIHPSLHRVTAQDAFLFGI